MLAELEIIWLMYVEQLEQAWWFYEDFLADEYDHLEHFRDFDNFTAAMFQHHALLRPLIPKYDRMKEEFKQYMRQIPVYGAALLTPDMTHVLLVQSFHGKYWGFPKGKVNQSERPIDCALREVYEEVGFDGRQYVNELDYLEVISKQGKKTGVFVMKNVPPDYAFEPRVRKEIAGIQWFHIDSLPTQPYGNDSNKRKFNLHGFVPKLKKWVWRQHKAARGRQQGSRQKGRALVENARHQGSEDRSRGRHAAPAASNRDMPVQKVTQPRRTKERSRAEQMSTYDRGHPFAIDVQAVMESMSPFLTPLLKRGV